jgi:tRNA-specific 2-thiouridylase
MKERILVGLSGGVDSALTVKLLQKDGYEVTGLFLEMLTKNSFVRAEILAKQLKVNLIKKDIKNIFQQEIVDDFLQNYAFGKTPNPCVLCNPQIKFKYLLQIADELNIKYVATGHYTEVQKSKNNKSEAVEFEIKKAKDKIKDQSYFLYRLKQEELRRIKFPLGELLKENVKKMAQENKLKIPKLESQDVCFLKEGRLDNFLIKNLSAKYFKVGKIIDEDEKVVGQHRGLVIYTVGQRKGLDVGGDGPFYVSGKDWKNNVLRVTRQREDLNKKIIYFSEVNWINTKPIKNKKYQIKIRYQMKEIDAILKSVAFNKWQAVLSEEAWAVMPGQSLVVYDRDKLIGGGIIL